MIAKYFNNTLLKNIKKQDYQRFLDSIADNHVKDTVARLNGYIRRSLDDAIDDQIIHRNFTRNIVLSGSTQKIHPFNYLNEKDILNLKEYCIENNSLMHITLSEILFALLTGCRYGEVVGLTWDCINWTNRNITINKTYDYKNRTGFMQTKTNASNRTIDISKDIFKMLRSIQKQQKKLFLSQGFQNELNLVFINNKHEIPTSNAANKLLKQSLEFINADNNITFHGLRHTHASYLIANDISIDYISERLGHADTSITSKVYVHLLKEKREEEKNKTIALLDSL